MSDMSDIMQKRIDNVYIALGIAKSDWAKNYWAVVLVILLRQMRSEKPTVH
mgnify:FL=1|jgi:hypothetical protein